VLSIFILLKIHSAFKIAPQDSIRTQEFALYAKIIALYAYLVLPVQLAILDSTNKETNVFSFVILDSLQKQLFAHLVLQIAQFVTIRILVLPARAAFSAIRFV
jgi:hypothetical protein